MILKPDRKLWTPPRNRAMPRSWFKQRGFFTPFTLQKPFTVDAADFDGTNDYMTRGAGLNGAADGKVGTISFWFRLDGGDGDFVTIVTNATAVGGPTSRWRVRRENNNRITVVGLNAAATEILRLTTNTAYTASATWRHFLASWDLAAAAGHLYVTDVSDLAAGPTLTDDSVDYTVADWAIGGQANGGTKVNGALANVFFVPSFFDLSVTANRRKFILANGKPANLGPTGAYPTGTAPLVYQSLKHGEAVANFATNRGTGGDFTITGTLDTASTSPSD